MRLFLYTLIAGIALTGCASPFDTAQVKDSGLAGDAKGQPQSAAVKVLWGGQIIDAKQTGNGTRLEVRAYPLGLGDRPLIGVRNSGRHFAIDHPEALDLDDYQSGRFVTAMGTFADIESVTVADKDFQMPVMASVQIEIWPADAYPDSLDPFVYTQEVRNTSWFPSKVTPSTFSAGHAGSSGAH